MSSIRYISSSTPVPNDLAKKLGPIGVSEILLIFWQGYRALLADQSIVINEDTDEDDITLEWYGKISRLWNNSNRAIALKRHNIGPVHQYPDPTLKKEKGNKPTIDFCFRDWDTSNSYFGAECKNLYKNRRDMIRRYNKTGVENYTSGRYGSLSSESSLIGYVLSGSLPTIVNELTNELKKASPIYNLTRDFRFVEPQYYSRHIRSLDAAEITLHHLFFNFSFS